jgi:serine/threonine protein kinase
MAPEQARSLSDLDGRVDVYALGIMLFELIAGRPPVRARPADGRAADAGRRSSAELRLPGRGAGPWAWSKRSCGARWPRPRRPAGRRRSPLAAAFRSAITAPDSQTLAPLPTPAPATPPEPSAPGRSRRGSRAPRDRDRDRRDLPGAPPARVRARDGTPRPCRPSSPRLRQPPPPPPSSAPTAQALPPVPASSAVASQPATVKIEAAPSRPRPAPSRAPVPTEAARDLARAADTALLSCRCAGAEAALRALAEAPGRRCAGRAPARPPRHLPKHRSGPSLRRRSPGGGRVSHAAAR